MGFRYRKSTKLAKGTRLNHSKNGINLSLNLGGGVFFNQKLFKSSKKKGSKTLPNYTYKITEEGEVEFYDWLGLPHSPDTIALIKRKEGESIKRELSQMAKNISDKIAKIALEIQQLPLAFLPPRETIVYEKEEYPELTPPTLKKINLWLWIPLALLSPFLFFIPLLFLLIDYYFIQKENNKKIAIFQKEKEKWLIEKEKHNKIQESLKFLLENKSHSDKKVMEAVILSIRNKLKDKFSFQEKIITNLLEEGENVHVQIYFPSSLNFPTKVPTYTGKGYKLNWKNITQKEINETYARFIYGISAIYAGELFYNLPKLQNISIEGFTMERDKSKGEEKEKKLFSSLITRQDWSKINFDNLEHIQAIDLFDNFSTKRDITKTFIMKEIL